MRSRTGSLAVTIALMVILGSGCSSSDESSAPDVGSAGSTGAVQVAAHNEADVEFAQGMIPHHEQAVEMARLATTRAEDERVVDLAERIEAAQAPEIEQMNGWLESWEEATEGPGEHGGEHAGSAGMLSEEDLDALEAASGAQFDRLFLAMMTEHHQGAVEMAEAEIGDGEFSDAVALAERIKATQQAEIAEMETLLAESLAENGA